MYEKKEMRMPRKSKTQRIETAPNQAYGVANEQKQSMNVLPLPNRGTENPTAESMSPGNMPPSAPTEQPASQDDFARMMEAAIAEQPPSMPAFTAPTQRPDEPLMTMPTQPVQGGQSYFVSLLNMTAEASDNPNLARLANLIERGTL